MRKMGKLYGVQKNSFSGENRVGKRKRWGKKISASRQPTLESSKDSIFNLEQHIFAS